MSSKATLQILMYSLAILLYLVMSGLKFRKTGRTLYGIQLKKNDVAYKLHRFYSSKPFLAISLPVLILLTTALCMFSYYTYDMSQGSLFLILLIFALTLSVIFSPLGKRQKDYDKSKARRKSDNDWKVDF